MSQSSPSLKEDSYLFDPLSDLPEDEASQSSPSLKEDSYRARLRLHDDIEPRLKSQSSPSLKEDSYPGPFKCLSSLYL